VTNQTLSTRAGRGRSREPAILLGSEDLERLRSVVEAHAFGRDEAATERLAAELDRATIVPQAEVPPDVVTMNARIAFEDPEAGRRREITLCYPRDADPANGRISILAPVAMALLGLRLGDSIDWPLPGARRATFRIAAIVAQAEEPRAVAR
jgi:regulator of nucleoside diphosphate kinase